MKEKLEQIKAEAVAKIQEADVPEKLNDVRVKFLGKKGELTAVLKGMKDVAPEERPKVGQLVNDTRAAIEELLEESKAKMEKAIREENEKIEVHKFKQLYRRELNWMRRAPGARQTKANFRIGRFGEIDESYAERKDILL